MAEDFVKIEDSSQNLEKTLHQLLVDHDPVLIEAGDGGINSNNYNTKSDLHKKLDIMEMPLEDFEDFEEVDSEWLESDILQGRHFTLESLLEDQPEQLIFDLDNKDIDVESNNNKRSNDTLEQVTYNDSKKARTDNIIHSKYGPILSPASMSPTSTDDGNDSTNKMEALPTGNSSSGSPNNTTAFESSSISSISGLVLPIHKNKPANEAKDASSNKNKNKSLIEVLDTSSNNNIIVQPNTNPIVSIKAETNTQVQIHTSAHSVQPAVPPKKFTNEYTISQISEMKQRMINTHKLMLNFNLLKNSYARTCVELKKALVGLKDTEIHRTHLFVENEQLKKELNDLKNSLKQQESQSEEKETKTI